MKERHIFLYHLMRLLSWADSALKKYTPVAPCNLNSICCPPWKTVVRTILPLKSRMMTLVSPENAVKSIQMYSPEGLGVMLGKGFRFQQDLYYPQWF